MMSTIASLIHIKGLFYFAMSGGEQKEEEIQKLQKYTTTLEAELDDVHSQLAETASKLDTTEKQLALVTHTKFQGVFD